MSLDKKICMCCKGSNSVWTDERLNDWMNELNSERINGWTAERLNDWMNEWTKEWRGNEWTNKRTIEIMNEELNKGVNQWTSLMSYVNTLVNETVFLYLVTWCSRRAAHSSTWLSLETLTTSSVPTLLRKLMYSVWSGECKHACLWSTS